MWRVLVLSIVCLVQISTAKEVPLPKSDTTTDIAVHATNKTSVPSVRYIVDAVECLRQAYSVYTEPSDKAKLYAELFQEKHNETEWNVVIGYTAAFIKSEWYVETSVASSSKNKDKKDKDKEETSYLLFSKA